MENRAIHILFGIADSIKNLIIGAVLGLVLSGLTWLISYSSGYGAINKPVFSTLSIFDIISFLPSAIYILVIIVGFKGLTVGSIAYLAGWIITMGALVYFGLLEGLNAALDFEVPLIFVGFKFAWLLSIP